MSKKISHSAWSKYLVCPKLYDLHYNQKLRPKGTTSALLFGSAIDAALNVMLLKTGDPYEEFKKHFEFDSMSECQFDEKDYDPEILSAEQIAKINGQSIESN